jgi:DNA-binding NtrC family response regulator
MRCEQVFQAAGYHIFTTDLGRSAIAFLRETSDPPDLVVCDTDAADVRALDVAEAAYRRDTKVIPISSDRFAEQGRDGFEFDTLVARVESMLPSSYLERPRSA